MLNSLLYSGLRALSAILMKLAAVILAGGQSRRMKGQDKSLITVAGTPLIDHVAMRIGSQVSSILVSANESNHGALAELGYAVVCDSKHDKGPVWGIVSCLRWLQQNAPELDAIVTLPCDTPVFPQDLITRFQSICEAAPDRPVYVVTSGHAHYTFGLWPLALSTQLEALYAEGKTSLRACLSQLEAQQLVYSPQQLGPMDFFNLNQPEDIELVRVYMKD